MLLLVLPAGDMCRGALKGSSNFDSDFQTHLVRRPPHDAPDDCHPESDLQLSCFSWIVSSSRGATSNAATRLSISVHQFAWVQVMRRLSPLQSRAQSQSESIRLSVRCRCRRSLTSRCPVASCQLATAMQLARGNWQLCYLAPSPAPHCCSSLL